MQTANRHPILIVLVILGGVALFLGATLFVLLKTVGPSSSPLFSEKIGVIPIEGAIKDSREVISQLIAFKEDAGIKAIILRIDSPGGGVGPSQEIYREVRRTAATKKVVASMGGVAASGGYYIAAAADKIVANPGTVTGSIGVIMEFFRFQDLLKKIGVDLETVKSGEFKDIGSPVREMTERDKEILRTLISDIKSQFVEAVAEGRNLPVEKVQQIADGRIFSGAQAKELGLVDALGNFRDAVDLAKQLAGIKGRVSLAYPPKERFSVWDLLFESAAGSFAKFIERANMPFQYKWNGVPIF